MHPTKNPKSNKLDSSSRALLAKLPVLDTCWGNITQFQTRITEACHAAMGSNTTAAGPALQALASLAVLHATPPEQVRIREVLLGETGLSQPISQLLKQYLDLRLDEAKRLASPSPAMHPELDTGATAGQLKASAQVRAKEWVGFGYFLIAFVVPTDSPAVPTGGRNTASSTAVLFAVGGWYVPPRPS